MDQQKPFNFNLDYLNLKQIKAFQIKLGQEEIVYSNAIFKYNRRCKKQNRNILLTDKAIYNLDKVKIKRKILYSSIKAISINNFGNEFVLHVPEEYDYRFKSQHRQIILSLLKEYIQDLKIFALNCEKLGHVVTTRIDKEKGISRIPQEQNIEEQFEEGKEQICVLKNLNNMDIIDVRNSLLGKNYTQEQLKKLTMPLYNNPRCFENPQQAGAAKITIDDFNLLKVLGRGTFGKVMLAERRNEDLNKQGKMYAIKSIHKEDIRNQKSLQSLRMERQILEQVNSPFLVKLAYAFQTPEKVFFVMEFLKGGELFQHLRNERGKGFSEERTRFYVAEIFLGLQCLHKLNIIYRDLKPENILLDERGHVCLTDFGISKIIQPDQSQYSLVGTPEYLAPELILQQGYDFKADFWGLGILCYEMLYGKPPFVSQNRGQLFYKIIDEQVTFPSQNIQKTSPEVQDFIDKLLIKDKNLRFGEQEIINHPWLKDIQWDQLLNKSMQAPFIPPINQLDKIFDPQFINEPIKDDSVPNKNKEIDIIDGITYQPGVELPKQK